MLVKSLTCEQEAGVFGKILCSTMPLSEGRMESECVTIEAFMLADDFRGAEQYSVESGVFDDGVKGFVDAHALFEVMIVEMLQDLQEQFVGKVIDRDWHDEIVLMTDGDEGR